MPTIVLARSQSYSPAEDSRYNVLNRLPAAFMPLEQSGHLSRAQDANGRTWQAVQGEIAATLQLLIH